MMTNKNDLFVSIREFLNSDTDLKIMEQEFWRQFGDRCAILVLECRKFTRISLEA
jgi:hypothetical protein